MARDVVPQRGFYSGGRISGRLGACAARFPAAGVIEAPKMAARAGSERWPQTGQQNAALRSWSASFQDPL